MWTGKGSQMHISSLNQNLAQAEVSVQWVVISAETHDCSRCSEYIRIEYLALNKLFMPPPLWLENTVGKKGEKACKSRRTEETWNAVLGHDNHNKLTAAVTACSRPTAVHPQPLLDLGGANETTHNPCRTTDNCVRPYKAKKHATTQINFIYSQSTDPNTEKNMNCTILFTWKVQSNQINWTFRGEEGRKGCGC